MVWRSGAPSRPERSLAVAVAAVLWLVLPCLPALAQGPDRTIRDGWFHWDPYQYVVVKNDVKRLTGLDVQLMRAIFGRMGYQVSYDEVPWGQHLREVESGARDIATGAFKTPEREAYAYFSRPMRQETHILYVRRGEAARYRFTDADGFFRQLGDRPFRLGVIDGYYYGPVAARFLADRVVASTFTRMGAIHFGIRSPIY